MNKTTLLMALLGCRPPGRNTEQHDVFFGIGKSLKDLVPAIKASWPETKGNIHIDAWRAVTVVDGFAIRVIDAGPEDKREPKDNELYFINLGGYKENEFDEFHYKLLVVAPDLEAAKMKARKTAFFKHMSVSKTADTPNATAHIDDKFGIDVDDAFRLEDILPPSFKEKYRLVVTRQGDDNRTDVSPAGGEPADTLHLGYFRLIDLK